MAEETSKLGLRKPTEDEYFDIVGDFNANWDKIDALTHIVDSGKKTSDFNEPGKSTVGGTVTWYYKKFDDGTFEMFGNLTVNNWKCENPASSNMYRTTYMKIKYPQIGQTEILYRNQSIRDGTDTDADNSLFNYIIDVSTVADSLTYSTVRAYCNAKETAARAKNVYIEVKGLWA